jgi:hypothetical protein
LFSLRGIYINMYKQIERGENEIKEEKENGFFLASELKPGDYIKVKVIVTESGEQDGVFFPIIKIRSTRKRKNNTVIQSDDISPDNELLIKSDIYVKKYTQKFVSECKKDFVLGYFEKSNK